RTQDLPPLFEENSCLYLFTGESFNKIGRRIGSHPLMYETEPIESIDIDDEFTFRLAEVLAGYAHR
ncbi:MAG: acylneuraminate cytidylyltransferase family protein, partial [Acidobacteriota bacterium]